MREKIKRGALCLLAITAALNCGCAMTHFGSLRPSKDITRQFQDMDINPNYRYWYLNQENNPFGVLGLDREYDFEGGPQWGVLDPDAAKFKKVVGLVQDFPVKGSTASGFEIMDSQGRQIGVWFSSLTAGVTMDSAKKTVSVTTPTPWIRPYSKFQPEQRGGLLYGRRLVRVPG
jgi:hypothetical protein